MLFKCVTCSAVCEIWGCCGVTEERLLRREGGGRGVLFENRPCMVWEAETWRSAPDYIKGQIGGFVLHQLTTGADLTISVR